MLEKDFLFLQSLDNIYTVMFNCYKSSVSVFLRFLNSLFYDKMILVKFTSNPNEK